MPFFSVIIPTYNRASELKRSLESVLAQTFKDFEIVVVDDGSTDNTHETVTGYNTPAIKYIRQDNAERSAARNNGIANASGKYLCLLDSDDIFYEDHLQVLHQQIVQDKEPVAIYKTLMHYADGSRPDDLSYAYRGDDRNSAIKYVWYNGSQIDCLCFHNEIGRTTLFPERFFWFEDVHWITRVVMQYPLRQISAHTTKYFNNANGNMLSDNRYEKYENNCVACIRDLEQMHGPELKAMLGNKCFDIKVAELYLGLVVAAAARYREPKLGYSYLIKAMRVAITPRLLAKYAYYSLKLLKTFV